MQTFIEFTVINADEIRSLREQSRRADISRIEFPVRWIHDRTGFSEFLYKGYASVKKPSEVSGLPRFFYDRNQPFEKMVKHYDHYVPDLFIKKPEAYVIPQGWWKVIELLRLNKVKMLPLRADTVIEVETYRIEDYKSTARQYEMHHPNSEVKLNISRQKIRFRPGDLYIPMNQVANRFLVETLEPQAEDSYFCWNFFDAVLGQKEGFSAYAFEDIAADYLNKNPDLRAKLNQRKANDTSFANSARAQLNFVYEHSPWFEPEYLRYPVYRIPAK
jgi:hypothetical protein